MTSGRYCVSKSIIVSAMSIQVNTSAANAVNPKPKCQAMNPDNKPVASSTAG